VSVGYRIINVHQWFISWMSKVSLTHANIFEQRDEKQRVWDEVGQEHAGGERGEPQNFMRARAKAAMTLIAMVMTTTNTDTIAELRKKVRYWFCVSSSM